MTIFPIEVVEVAEDALRVGTGELPGMSLLQKAVWFAWGCVRASVTINVDASYIRA